MGVMLHHLNTLYELHNIICSVIMVSWDPSHTNARGSKRWATRMGAEVSVAGLKWAHTMWASGRRSQYRPKTSGASLPPTGSVHPNKVASPANRRSGHFVLKSKSYPQQRRRVESPRPSWLEIKSLRDSVDRDIQVEVSASLKYNNEQIITLAAIFPYIFWVLQEWVAPFCVL